MKRNVFLTLLLFVFVGFNLHAQDFEVTGTVTAADDGSPLPGVSVVVQGTNIGSVTDVNGVYTISVPAEGGTLMVSYVGMATQTFDVSSAQTNDVSLVSESEELGEVVVTALGISREKKSLGYAVQEVNSEDINVTSDANIKNVLAGKVAGVQLVGQAGSKLGQNGRIRIRGAVSLTQDADPLYVVDGVAGVDPNMIDMENVDNVSVLKGPNATALYGQRAEYGVVMITTKRGKKGGVTVEINSNTTFEKVSYLPNYQNEYGAGYDGADEWTTFDYAAGHPWTGAAWPEEWAGLDGQKFIYHGFADESWGPKLDGSDYIAWYNWWPDSPYYGETSKWEAHPDNIKNFYDTGVTMKNSIAVSGGSNKYTARLSYTNLDQSGLLPESSLKKHMVNGNIHFNATKKLTMHANFNLSSETVTGDFDDSYSNQTTGSFNSWFARDLDMSKMKELQDLKTTDGYHASWNYWNPMYAEYFGTQNGAFWYNPYFWLKNYKREYNNTRLMGKIEANYKITENLEVVLNGSTYMYDYDRYYQKPYAIANSSDPGLYNVHNSGFGNYTRETSENNLGGFLKFEDSFGDINVRAIAGSSLRTNSYDRWQADMATQSKTQGLVIPDVFTYSNTKEPVTANTFKWNKEVRSVYGNVSIDYNRTFFLDASLRRDWSSALPADNNGYSYPSVGGSFVFSNLVDLGILSFGKVRASWAQIGSDVGALALNSTYPLSGSPYFGLPQMYTKGQSIDPNITPAFNSSTEFGFDLNFLEDRIGTAFTYFSETREDEISAIAMSTATGSTSYLTNAGSSKRSGIELTIDARAVESDNFKWDVFFNIGTSQSEILGLPGDLESMNGPGGGDDWAFVRVTHSYDAETKTGSWGELRGIGFTRDEDGNKLVNADGLYETETDVYFGSILPDFTGGLLNNFTLFNIVTLSAAIDFQKGGNFFSLSEMWGQYSGLLEETAGNNDANAPKRDLVADGGGVHVKEMMADGTEFDGYVEAYDYFNQFNSNTIAEPYIHDASFIKLREIGVSVRIPQNIIDNTFIKYASVGFIGRNLWLNTSKDNVHGWDPSELSGAWGENAQLPGTRSYGFNVKLTF